MPAAGGDLWIANTVTDLIQGDINEHIALEAIPLQGDVLGLGTTTSVDNGELTFLRNGTGGTTIWKCQASDGGIRALHPGDGSAHFPYACFSSDATAVRLPVDPAELGPMEGASLQPLIGACIARLRAEGRLPEAPIYGLRLRCHWQGLVITVSSKLCMAQLGRNRALTLAPEATAEGSASIYDQLQHFRFSASDPGDPADPVRFLGRSLEWDCCGFWDTDPSQGRVTVPDADDSLHLHGCSTDLRYGGHLRLDHGETRLRAIETLAIYPLSRLHALMSDLVIEDPCFAEGVLRFTVANRGALDISDVGIAVVIDDCYSSHRYLRVPWLQAGAVEPFAVPLTLTSGSHRLEVIADPEQSILEGFRRQSHNRSALEVRL